MKSNRYDIQIVFLRFLLVLFPIILSYGFIYLIISFSKFSIETWVILILSITIGILYLIYDVIKSKINAEINANTKRLKNIINLVIFIIIGFTLFCIVFLINNKDFPLYQPLTLLLYWIFLLFSNYFDYNKAQKFSKNLLLSLFKLLFFIPIIVLISLGVRSNRFFILLLCILSSLILFYFLERKNINNDKDKLLSFLILLLFFVMPLLFIIGVESMENKPIYFNTPNSNQWVSIFSGIIAYLGTAFLGILAFWQNNKLAKINQDMRDKEVAKNKPIIFVKYHSSSGNNYDIRIGNLGEIALLIKLKITSNEKLIENYSHLSDVLLNTVGTDYNGLLKIEFETNEGQIEFEFSYENKFNDHYITIIPYNLIEDRNKTLIGTTKLINHS